MELSKQKSRENPSNENFFKLLNPVRIGAREKIGNYLSMLRLNESYKKGKESFKLSRIMLLALGSMIFNVSQAQLNSFEVYRVEIGANIKMYSPSNPLDLDGYRFAGADLNLDALVAVSIEGINPPQDRPAITLGNLILVANGVELDNNTRDEEIAHYLDQKSLGLDYYGTFYFLSHLISLINGENTFEPYREVNNGIVDKENYFTTEEDQHGNVTDGPPVVYAPPTEKFKEKYLKDNPGKAVPHPGTLQNIEVISPAGLALRDAGLVGKNNQLQNKNPMVNIVVGPDGRVQEINWAMPFSEFFK